MSTFFLEFEVFEKNKPGYLKSETIEIEEDQTSIPIIKREINKLKQKYKAEKITLKTFRPAVNQT
jgi:hypothetical protein